MISLNLFDDFTELFSMILLTCFDDLLTLFDDFTGFFYNFTDFCFDNFTDLFR